MTVFLFYRNNVHELMSEFVEVNNLICDFNDTFMSDLDQQGLYKLEEKDISRLKRQFQRLNTADLLTETIALLR